LSSDLPSQRQHVPSHASPLHVLIYLEASVRGSSLHISVVERSQTLQPMKRSPAGDTRKYPPAPSEHLQCPLTAKVVGDDVMSTSRTGEPHHRSDPRRSDDRGAADDPWHAVSRHLHSRRRNGCCYRAATSEQHLTQGVSKGLPVPAPPL
jgi:hypothetical protein